MDRDGQDIHEKAQDLKCYSNFQMSVSVGKRKLTWEKVYDVPIHVDCYWQIIVNQLGILTMNLIAGVSDYIYFSVNLMDIYMDNYTYHEFSKVLIPNLK